MAVGLDDAKKFLNITRSDNDGELTTFLEAAYSHVEKLTGPIGSRQVTETHYNAGNVIVLKVAPAVSLVSVSTAGALGGLAMDESAAWHLDPESAVMRRAAAWYRRPAVVTVSYYAGRVTVPDEINVAVLYTLKRMWRTQRGASPMPANPDAMQYQGPDDLPPDVMELLAPYRLPPGVA